MTQTIKCNNCGAEIEVSEALTHQLEEQVLVSIKADYEKRIEETRKESEEKARRKIAAEADLKIKDKENENNELKEKNVKLQEEVLKMARDLRLLNEKLDSQDLENQKKLNLEISKIREEVIKNVTMKSQGEIMELKKQLDDSKKALDVANYKLTQKSQQLQGEVLELDLERNLKQTFMDDEIVPIEKGKAGADIIHKVKGKSGRIAGIILWETKRAKWSPGWIAKLREDARNEAASVAVLVCSQLPKDVENFQITGGIIITSQTYTLPLAGILRRSILQIAVAKQTAASKDENLEFLYEYLQSETFRHRFEAFAEGVKQMEDDLAYEKSATERVWKRREVQISKMLLNASRMYGELQGVMGNSLPDIKVFALPETAESS